MSIPYEATGRTAQKMRTRKALIDAARVLIADGVTPTVEDAAAKAAISRTTAYRYFPNQRDLLIAAYPETNLPSLLGANPPSDVTARLDSVVRAYLDMTIENEAALRAALRLSLEMDEAQRENLLVRQGRVIAWLKDALEPLAGQLSKQAMARLVYAIRAAAGIEALIWLCDVAGVSRDEAKELMMWSAHSLLRAILTELTEAHPSHPARAGDEAVRDS
ncbi:MAG TPA: helix-turn-helix domain-containing protein [Ktedonobacterales bacterium]